MFGGGAFASGPFAAGPSASGSVSITFSPPVVAEGYRYLRVRMSTSVADSVTVTIGSKTWTVSTTTSPADYDLDLCCPHNTVATVDDQDTRWPLATVGGAPTNEGPLWGINRISAMDITAAGASTVLTVVHVRLQRLEYGTLTPVAAFKEWIEKHPEVDGVQVYVKPFCVVDADGKMVCDLTDMERHTIGGNDYVYTWPTLRTGLVSSSWPGLDQFTGWVPTLASSFPDTYHTIDNPGTGDPGGFFAWLGGNGAVRLADGVWAEWFDRAIGTSNTDLYAQSLWDQVIGYPHSGDVWIPGNSYPAEGTDPGFPLYFNKVARGQAHGLVFHEDDTPHVGAEVVVIETGASPEVRAGDARSGTRGQYQTGLPYGRGNVGHDIQLRVGMQPWLDSSSTFVNRLRRRASFRRDDNTGGGQPSNFFDDWGRFHRVNIEAGNVWYRRADIHVPLPAFSEVVQVTSDDDATHCDIRWQANRGALHVVYTRADGNTYTRYSWDDGKTWGSEVLAMAGIQSRTGSDEDHTEWVATFVYDSGTSGPGKIYLKRRRAEDTAFGSSAAIQSGGVALSVTDDGFDICAGLSRWILTCTIDGEGGESEWQSWDEGATWKRIA